MNEMEASACSCSDFDYEPMEVSTQSHPTARKEHKCGECGRTIKKGEIYEYMKCKLDDEWVNFKTCKQCEQIRSDYCGPYGDLYTHIWELLGVELGGKDESRD